MAGLRRVIAAALVLAGLTGCGGRGAVPPNSLTALLRSVPQGIETEAPSFDHGDVALARSQTGAGHDGELPSPVIAGVAATGSAGYDAAIGWSLPAVDTWLEVSPTGAPRLTTIVGRFDTAAISARLRSFGWQSHRVELFEVFTPGDGSSRAVPGLRELTEQIGAVGVAEKRLLYSRSPASVDAVATFRGGDNSLLALPGVKPLAVGAGSAAATSSRIPRSGCPRALWSQVALRYAFGPAGTAYVLQYSEAADAVAAAGLLSEQLSPWLPAGSSIGVVDARSKRSVVAINATPSDMETIYRLQSSGSGMADLPAC